MSESEVPSEVSHGKPDMEEAISSEPESEPNSIDLREWKDPFATELIEKLIEAAKLTQKTRNEHALVAGFVINPDGLAGVVSSAIIEGERSSVDQAPALDELRERLADEYQSPMVIAWVHTHPPPSQEKGKHAPQLSGVDKLTYANDIHPENVIINQGGRRVEVQGPKPLDIMIRPNGPQWKNSEVLITQELEQPGKRGKTAVLETPQYMLNLISEVGADSSDPRLSELLSRQGAKQRRFRLGDQVELRQFIHTALPDGLRLVPISAPPPNFDFLGPPPTE